MNKYSIIYADPPWDYKGQKQHAGAGKTDTGGAIEHYPTMTLAELKKLSIESLLEPAALLFMWVTNPHLDQGLELMTTWGFKYATVAFVWDKQVPNPGFYTLSQAELCLVGKHGKIPQPRGIRNARQFLSKKRTKHSEKPVEIQERIELMFPTQKKLELFARKSREGWDAFGNEVENSIPLETI